MKGRFSAGRATVGIVLMLCLLLQAAPSQPARAQIGPSGGEFEIAIDAAAHDQYGLFYPVTYIFAIPAGAGALEAQYRYAADGAWQTLPEYQAGEVFNGVQAARFDYDGDMAYLSVAFAPDSDSIFLRVVNQAGVPVVLIYEGMAHYYDDRHAVVTITLDDWADYMIDSIDYASGVLAGMELYHTVSVLTGAVSDWPQLRARVASGYTEVAAHTRYHPCSAEGYIAYGGYDVQIAGSRDDLLTHVLTPLSDPEYVTAFVQPCGFENDGVRQAVVDAGFLADRDYDTGPGVGDVDFAAWGGDGAYEQILSTYLVLIDIGRWEDGGSQEDLDQANAAFDTAYAAAGIYHLTDHPDFSLWDGVYLPQHLAYIAGRPDVWYAGFGHLYLYHFVEERGLVTVTATAPPTAAELARFAATYGEGAIQIEWETRTEIDNVGFNVYRAETPDGELVRLNEFLIPSQMPGAAMGASYCYLDQDVRPGGTYYYWLESLDVHGAAAQAGPVSAMVMYRYMLPYVER
jgi:hypothetical protein